MHEKNYYGRGQQTPEGQGRQKKRCEDTIPQCMKLLQLKKEVNGDRKKWRRRIRLADPSPGRD